MTKLFEWVYAFFLIFGIWFALVTNKIETEFTRQNATVIFWSPVYLVGVFGIWTVTLLLYRTFTFNDCETAAVELKKEIEDAKEDLARLGFKFNESVS